MRKIHASIAVLSLLPIFAACHSASPLPAGTFVNQSDPAQVLELKLDPGQTPNVFIRVSMQTGANKYFGKTVGTYVFKTRDVTKGTFVWAKTRRDGNIHEVWLKSDTGKTWTLTVQPDGSLADSTGAVWRHS
jgi:hypothetical protein